VTARKGSQIFQSKNLRKKYNYLAPDQLRPCASQRPHGGLQTFNSITRLKGKALVLGKLIRLISSDKESWKRREVGRYLRLQPTIRIASAMYADWISSVPARSTGPTLRARL